MKHTTLRRGNLVDIDLFTPIRRSPTRLAYPGILARARQYILAELDPRLPRCTASVLCRAAHSEPPFPSRSPTRGRRAAVDVRHHGQSHLLHSPHAFLETGFAGKYPDTACRRESRTKRYQCKAIGTWKNLRLPAPVHTLHHVFATPLRRPSKVSRRASATGPQATTSASAVSITARSTAVNAKGGPTEPCQ